MKKTTIANNSTIVTKNTIQTN